MPKFFSTPNPSNTSLDPQKTVIFFDEECPTKIKNMNKEVVWVGDEVYFEGGKGKLTKIIQIGVGPDDYNLAEVTLPNGKKARVNAKALYHTRLDNIFQNNGLGLPILVGLVMVFLFWLICYLSDVLSFYDFVFTW